MSKEMIGIAEMVMLAKAKYKSKKDESSKAYAALQQLEGKLIEMIDESGLDAFKVDGLGSFSVNRSPYVATPKSPTEKQALFDYIREKLGEDGMYSYMSINANSLNSYYKQEMEDSDSPATFILPGIGAPTERVKLSIRSK